MQERNTLQARGFLQIINNQHIQRLVNDSHLDEEAKKRIRSLEYSNYSSFYHIKENSMITMTPAKSLGRSICHADDSTIKWFLMLYSIASVNDIFIEKIHSFIDERIKRHWYRSGDHLRRVTGVQINDILSSVPDLDAYFSDKGNFGPMMREWDFYKQAIVLFCLSAGHHWENSRSYIPNELLNRHYEMPIILSSAFYISVLTGKEFYEALKEVLKSYGNEEMLDDIIIMVKAERERQNLISQKEELLKQLSVCEEKIRKQETALDISVNSFGKGLTKDDLDAKINHCNKDSFRAVLYKAENILGKRLSITDRLPDNDEKGFLVSKLSEEYNIILSNEEILSVNTYEELIEVIQSHCRFIDNFMGALYMGVMLDATSENAQYGIQTKIREIKKTFGEDLDTSDVHNEEELKNAVSQKHPTLNFKAYLVEYLGIDPSEVTPNANFVNDLGADSLDIVEIVMHIEKTLKINIPDEEWANAETIGEAHELICRKVREKANNQK